MQIPTCYNEATEALIRKVHERLSEKDRQGVSLPRERFWDIPVAKIDSPTRQLLLPRPPCVRAAPPHPRKLGAGSAALPQWLDGVSDARAYGLRRLRLPGTTRLVLRTSMAGSGRLVV